MRPQPLSYECDTNDNHNNIRISFYTVVVTSNHSILLSDRQWQPPARHCCRPTLQCVGCCSTKIWELMHALCTYRPDGIGTVLHEERDRFLEIKDRLRRLLEHQLTNFRYISKTTHVLTFVRGATHPVTITSVVECIRKSNGLLNYKGICLLQKCQIVFSFPFYICIFILNWSLEPLPLPPPRYIIYCNHWPHVQWVRNTRFLCCCITS